MILEAAGRLAHGGWALASADVGGSIVAGVVSEAGFVTVGQVAGLQRPSVRELIEHWDTVLPELEQLAAPGNTAALAIDSLRLVAPLEPRQIFQSGANYRSHVIDLAMAHGELDDGRPQDERRAAVAAELDERAATGSPYVFIGLPSAICGPYDDVVLPIGTTRNDWELELVAVIGRPARRVPLEQALDHVMGYTIANDVTTRETVFRRDMKDIGTDWLASKNAPTFLPLGPYIVPSRFAGDPGDVHLTLQLNGEVMQDESSKDMLFGVAALVSYCSSITTLLPGDLVLTGSPAGNGIAKGRLLRAGDVMEATISGLGVQRNRCVAEQGAEQGEQGAGQREQGAEQPA